MAHPCCMCGSECYCGGDIDDVIVSHTPGTCEGCGCEEFWDSDGDHDDSWDDDQDDWPDDVELIPKEDGGLEEPDTGIIHYP